MQNSDGSRMFRPQLLAAAVVLGLVMLPVAVWLDLRNLSDQALLAQGQSLNSIISDIRSYYARNVVSRVLEAPGQTRPLHNYHDVPGAIPIPATLSIELGEVIGSKQGVVSYRFVSDYPFANRAGHALDAFEQNALETFRRGVRPESTVSETSGSFFNRRTRIAAPVILGGACVECHNSHPESPRHDWQAGDVRGIQAITVEQPIAANILSFKYLLAYLLCAALAGGSFVLLQARQARAMRRMNAELETANSFLAQVSMKIAKYLSPQIYKSIFSGEKDVAISTERKKLTIFFSDIQNFTSMSERLQPEELTGLLNVEWHRRGLQDPFMVRMGINTGYCNVGNFGSADRMDYTIIGAEANLAARLQSIAEPGSVVISYETFALVQDMVRTRRLDPIRVKGINRDVVPYVVEGELDEAPAGVFNAYGNGMTVFIDIDMLDEVDALRLKGTLQNAMAALASRVGPEPQAEWEGVPQTE